MFSFQTLDQKLQFLLSNLWKIFPVKKAFKKGNEIIGGVSYYFVLNIILNPIHTGCFETLNNRQCAHRAHGPELFFYISYHL